VATATAVGLVVDAARMPIYLATEQQGLLRMSPLIAVATAGVVIGTITGTSLLARVPQSMFRSTVAVLLLALGAWMIVH